MLFTIKVDILKLTVECNSFKQTKIRRENRFGSYLTNNKGSEELDIAKWYKREYIAISWIY